jgi:hypothetical protein
MNDSPEERLSAVDLREPSAIARSRAIEAVRAQAKSGVSAKRSTPRFGAIALAVGCLLALTPPGISVARSVGGLVGIGDEPSDPIDLGGGPSDQAVIGVGETPGGVPYELATSDGRGSDARQTCFYLSLPTLDERSRSASCLTAEALRGLRETSIGSLYPERAPAGLGPDADIVLTGAATENVTRVLIEYPTADGLSSRELDLAPFQAESQSATGAEGGEPAADHLKAFAAFLPFHLDPAVAGDSLAMREAAIGYQQQLHEISLRAYDEDGNLIAEISPGDTQGGGTSLALAVG